VERCVCDQAILSKLGGLVFNGLNFSSEDMLLFLKGTLTACINTLKFKARIFRCDGKLVQSVHAMLAICNMDGDKEQLLMQWEDACSDTGSET